MILTEYEKELIESLRSTEAIYKDFLFKVSSREGLCLSDIPKKYITAELCLAAVKRSGANLYFVPEEFKSVEVCEAAFQDGNWVSMFIPIEFLDERSETGVKLLNEEEILEEYNVEELLTSKNAYLRELGKRVLK